MSLLFGYAEERTNDLKLKSFVATAAIDDEIVCSEHLLKTISKSCKDLSPMMDYLCAALDFEY